MGSTLTLNYTGSDSQSSTDDAINRVDFGTTVTTTMGGTSTSTYSGSTVEALAYLGEDTVVKDEFTQPGISLDYTGSTAGTYPGLDQFNRVVDQKWTNSSGTPIDEEKEGYNAQGNVAYEQNAAEVSYSAANPSLALKALDQIFAYIGTGQLDALAQGQIVTSSGNVTVDSLGNASLVSDTQNFSQNFTLDSAGNNTNVTETTDGTTTLDQSRSVNGANEITDVSNSVGTAWAVPEYDNAGNMTTIPEPGNESTGLTGVYNGWNELVVVKNGTTVIAGYQYDGQGNLIVTTEDGQTTDRYYAGSQLIETILGAPTSSPTCGQTFTTQQYVWSQRDSNALVLRTDATYTYSTWTSAWTASGAATYYFLTDANDNVTAVTDSSGNVLERYAYSAYGTATIYSADWTTTATTSSIGNTFLFGTMQVDTVTGLSHDGERWYNTSLAIFTTTDPALSSSNLYAYALDDPTTLTDPTGLQTFVSTIADNDSNHPVGPCEGEKTGAEAAAVNNATWNTLTAEQLQTVRQNVGPKQFYALSMKRGLQDVPTADFVPLSDDDANTLVRKALSTAALAALPAPTQQPVFNAANYAGSSISARPYIAWYKQPFAYVLIVAAKSGQIITSPVRLLDPTPNGGISKFFAERDMYLDDLEGDCGIEKYGPTDKALDVTSTIGTIFVVKGLFEGSPAEPAPIATRMPPNGGALTQPNILGGIGPKGPLGAPYSNWIRIGPNGIPTMGGEQLPGFDGGSMTRPPGIGPYPPPFSAN